MESVNTLARLHHEFDWLWRLARSTARIPELAHDQPVASGEAPRRRRQTDIRAATVVASQ